MTLTTHPRSNHPTDTRRAGEPIPPQRRRPPARVYLGWVAVAAGVLTAVVLAVLVLPPESEPTEPLTLSVSIRAIEGAEANAARRPAVPSYPSIRALEGAGSTAGYSSTYRYPSIRALDGTAAAGDR